MYKLISLLLCFALLSCSVQKRRYQKGFYVSRAHHSLNNNAFESTHTQLGCGNKQNSFNEYPKTPVVQAIKAEQATQKMSDSDSCDVIIFKDGSEVSGKILEFVPGQIKYKRCDLLSGPTYTVRKSDVFMIKYSNGVREVIKDDAPPPAQSINTVQVPPNYQIPKHNTRTALVSPNQKFHPSASWAFAWGLLSVISFFMLTTAPILILFSFTSAVKAIIASVKALRQINNYPADFKGKGLAITGRVLGIVVLSIFLIALIALLSGI